MQKNLKNLVRLAEVDLKNAAKIKVIEGFTMWKRLYGLLTRAEFIELNVLGDRDIVNEDALRDVAKRFSDLIKPLQYLLGKSCEFEKDANIALLDNGSVVSIVYAIERIASFHNDSAKTYADVLVAANEAIVLMYLYSRTDFENYQAVKDVFFTKLREYLLPGTRLTKDRPTNPIFYHGDYRDIATSLLLGHLLIDFSITVPVPISDLYF
jgi:hypothetical protein